MYHIAIIISIKVCVYKLKEKKKNVNIVENLKDWIKYIKKKKDSFGSKEVKLVLKLKKICFK